MKGTIEGPYYSPEDNEFYGFHGKLRKVAPEVKKVYRYLYDNANKLMLREDIMDTAFGKDNHDINKLYVYISRLRRIIKLHTGSSIYNVRGKGYKLIMP
ncbi:MULTISPECIES: winged helix-turn-helix domain-containing protein [Chitinophaga]|uniref:winged helix-turn-helix domain-containing protein n=1 Tax=Chitinophaga TaxID=79328 RepID=UPI0009A7122A|nr:winged helix-turn-helix domain-containing protein [Chitinophaga ginsengisegetis]